MSHPIYRVVFLKDGHFTRFGLVSTMVRNGLLISSPYRKANDSVYSVNLPYSAKFGLILKFILWFGRTGLIVIRRLYMTGRMRFLGLFTTFLPIYVKLPSVLPSGNCWRGSSKIRSLAMASLGVW